MNRHHWPKILPRPDYPIYQSNDRHSGGFTHQYSHVRRNNSSYPRDYTYQHNPLKKNSSSHPRDFNYHHNRLRKDNGRHSKGFTHQHYSVQNGGNNAISPSSFYHSCAKYQKMNNNEKHACNKQTKELHIKQEAPDKSPPREQLQAEDIGLPQVATSRSLSYRFPDQRPESLQKLCFPSSKRKHEELTTINTKETETSTGPSVQDKIPCTDKNGGQEESNAPCSSKSSKQSQNDGDCHQSSENGSSLPLCDKNRNIMVVSQENSDELCASPGEAEKEILPKASVDQFENDPEEDDVELLFDVKGKVKTSGQDKLEEKMDNSLSKESSPQSTNDPVLSCANQAEESSSDAESEVFDDVFLKTINKELDDEVSNSFTEENEASSAGESISPTFDSPLSRYLEDNADTLWENDDQPSLGTVPLSKEIEDNEIDGIDSNNLSGKDSNSETHDYLNDGVNTVDCIKKGAVESKNRECVVNSSPTSEKDAKKLLPFEQDSCQCTLEEAKNSPTVSTELLSTDVKSNHVHSPSDTTVNHNENEVNNDAREDCDDSAENTSDVEDAIRLIRATKSSVKVFESVIKEPLEVEQQKSGKEDDKVSEMAINRENREDQQIVAEETNDNFQPLDESLLHSVNKEVQRMEGTSEIGEQSVSLDNSQGVKQDTSDTGENSVDDSICAVVHNTDEFPKSVTRRPSEVDNTTTYDRLHSEVFASKMADHNKPVASTSSNVDKVVASEDTSNIPISSVEVGEIVVLKRPCQVSRESEVPCSGAEKDDVDDKYQGEPDDSGCKVAEAVAVDETTQLIETSVEQDTKVDDCDTNNIVSLVETSKVVQNHRYDPSASKNSEPEIKSSSILNDGRQDKVRAEYEATETDKNYTLDTEKTRKASLIVENQEAPETSGESESDIEISNEKAETETFKEGGNEESRDVEMSEVEQPVLSIFQNESKSSCPDSITTESGVVETLEYQETLMPECGANNQLECQVNPVDDQANDNVDSHTMDSEDSQLLNAKNADSVIESIPASTMYNDETPQTKADVGSYKNSESNAPDTVGVNLYLTAGTCEDATVVEKLSYQQQETPTKTREHQKDNKVEDNLSHFSIRQDSRETELSDAEQVEAQTTALISKLRELKKNCSVKDLLFDIFAKKTRVCSRNVETNDNDEERIGEKECIETTEGTDLFDDSPLLRSPSPESVMTDCQHSSTSVEELYVQNLLTKADALSDHELESTSHESSDIESNTQLDETHEDNLTQNTEILQIITQENENKTSTVQKSSQGNESAASLLASLPDSPRTSNMEKGNVPVQKRRRSRKKSRFRLTLQRRKNKNVASSNAPIKPNNRRSSRQRKARLIKKDSCFDIKSNLSSREIPYSPELYMKNKDRGLSNVSIKREKNLDFEDDMESADVEIDNEDCLSVDDLHLELSLVDDNLDRSVGIKQKDCSSILLMDDACNLVVSNSVPSDNHSTLVQKNYLGNSLRNEVLTLDGSIEDNVPDTVGMCLPEEVRLILASSIPSKNISPSLDESSVEASDATSHWSSSSTSSQDIEDPNCQSSTSTEDQRCRSTTIINDSECSSTTPGEDSLKVVLYNKRDPSTGTTNWTANKGARVKLTKPIVKKEPFSGYKLRRSKTRKTKKLLPTHEEPQAKRRRITITDLSAESQNPKSLLDLTKKPLENYIRTVEEVYRSPEKNSRKISTSKKDRVNKISSEDQEGDCLKLGDTEVMFEMVKKAFGESKIKRCRPSPRSLYNAAKQGSVLQVLVLAAGCNVNSTIPQEKHKTAMHAAASAGHADVLGILSLVGGNLSSLDTKLQTPLFDAVEHQQTDVVKFLISQHVNLNLKDSQGMTVLHVAAQKSHIDIIDLLMKTGKLDVNEQDNGGWTALMWTAEGMRMDAAKCLLKWGADVNILDIEQNTCLHWAALSGGTGIMDILLQAKVDIDARNVFGATAFGTVKTPLAPCRVLRLLDVDKLLHISARERKLPNITVLAKYRPNLEIKNADGKKAIELVPLNSKCYVQLRRMEMLMSLAKCTLKEHSISSDVSRGQEQRPIPCINEVDDETLPDDFVYVSNNLAGQSHCFDRSLTGCKCVDGCVNEKRCECAQLSARKRFWYDETGCINSEIFQEDRPLVYECNMKCKCWSSCHQRVVQRGITAGLQLYKTKEKGWAVRTQSLIRKGTFVCEYVGEVLTDNEADRREDDCYLFDLDVKGQSTLFCLDAKFYGNITRFINHSCDPNILPVRVFTDHQVKNCPRIAFFAARDIKPYEEICSNYGEKFWTVKKSEFNCLCRTTKCKYGGHTPSKK